jgi:hypothetical protein
MHNDIEKHLDTYNTGGDYMKKHSNQMIDTIISENTQSLIQL